MGKHRLALVGIVVVVFLVAVIVVNGVKRHKGDAGSNDQQEARSTVQQTAQQVSDPETQQEWEQEAGPGVMPYAQQNPFGTVQNDTAGYEGHRWGEPISDLHDQQIIKPSSLRYVSPVNAPNLYWELAQLLKVPDHTEILGGTSYDAPDYSVVPAEFQLSEQGLDDYIYYDGKLVMVYIALDADHEDAIYNDLMHKNEYLGVTEEFSSSFPNPLDGGDSENLQDLKVSLAKRLDTNTRVYLLKDVYHIGGTGLTNTDLGVFYIPNGYLQMIKSDTQKAAATQQEAAQEAATKAAQSDLNRIQ